jgi:hypothetical protein
MLKPGRSLSDVQIFAEALASIAHLIHRRSSSQVSPADRAIGELFEGRKIKPRRNVPLEGLLEKRILIERSRDFGKECPIPHG